MVEQTRVFPQLRPHGTGNERRTRLPIYLAVVQIVLAYEWLVSGIDKLVVAHFTVHEQTALHQSIRGNPYPWYAWVIQHILLPYRSLLVALVPFAEAIIGILLLLGAILWVLTPRHRITEYAAWTASVALVAAAFLELNYFFQGGTPLPWIDPRNAYTPGVDIDIVLPLISLVLAAANVDALRGASKWIKANVNALDSKP